MTTATILIVEDNPITRKMVRVALQSEGYLVLEAADGQTALELLTRHTPDLILQDLLLPDMDGFELVQKLRALPGGATVPILALSGLLSKLEQGRTLQVGFTDYLFKPVEPSHLLATLQTYLRPRKNVLDKPGQGRRLLLADDDAIQLKLLKVQMEQEGFQVSTAEDGVEALARAQASPPDAIVSDVLMPHLDGFRLCLAVRQDARLARVPVLLTSAIYTEEADRQLARSVGANAFLLRTPENHELTDALLACLNEGPAVPQQPPVELPVEEYTYRVIRQLEHHVGLNTRLTRRLALLEAELGILGRIVETLKNTSVLETVLDELLYRCLDAAGISCGAAYLLDADGRLALHARLGYPEAAREPLTDFFGHTDLLHKVMAQGEPIEVTAAGMTEERLEDLLSRAGARSILLTPLVLGEECLGVLQMASGSRELGEDWLSFAKAVGSQVGQAIQLARTLSRLSASEQRYRDLVHGLDAIVWERDVALGCFTFVSERASVILGYPTTCWLEEANFWESRLHPEDRERTLAFCGAALAEGRDHVLEYRMLSQDGRAVWLHDTIVVVHDAAGGVRQLRGIMVDVTERKQAEEQRAKMLLAREIQCRFFPTGSAQPAGFDLGGASYPAESTGGDYFDHIPMPTGCLAIVIGDVSGHGFGSALLMAETRAYLRALALSQTDVGAIITQLNRALVYDIAGDHFVTLLLAQLNPVTRSFLYTSAGHPRGYILDAAGKVKMVLGSTGIPLGIDVESEYPTSAERTLEPGDLVLFLTDGIMEAHAPDGTAFGSERTLNLVRHYRHDPPRQIVENLYHAVRAFCQNQPQDDDITAFVLKVEPAS